MVATPHLGEKVPVLDGYTRSFFCRKGLHTFSHLYILHRVQDNGQWHMPLLYLITSQSTLDGCKPVIKRDIRYNRE
jgi:hypothetical protein